MDHVFDVAIIGGGINGCGCAADAAQRGLSVILCEKDDIASKTSSSSTKLIHGGLRYLEHYDFRLVKQALEERQILLQIAPHLVHPLPIVLPYQNTMRPIWLLRMGLFLYDHLSRKNKLPNSQLIRRNTQPFYFTPLDPHLNKGFLFYDGATDDARLTLANAIQAKEQGATIMPQTELIKAEVIENQWLLTMQSKSSELFQIKAKSIVNAAGPWMATVNQLLNIPLEHNMSLVKGSHMVVHKLYEGEHAYLLQHDDGRVVFVIPYHHYTLIGTTDVAFTGVAEDVGIDESEIHYLCSLVGQYFNKKITETDIIRTWSGIRPLLAMRGKDPMELSRDYVYHYTSQPAPAITIYSGKMTTYRQLAREVTDQLRGVFPELRHSNTDITPLPGATLDAMSYKEYQHEAHRKYYWLDEDILTRYLHSYGTRTELILSECQKMEDLGICFTQTLYQVEVDYLVREEWAQSCEDILWRRTKLGLNCDSEHQKKLANYLAC